MCIQSLKRRVAIFLIFVMLIPINTYGAIGIDSGIKVFVDGVKVNFDVPPMVIEGRTMVPLRAIFEAVGATVSWNAETQMATAEKDGMTVNLYIGSLYPTVNDSVRPLIVPARIINGRTMAPLRFVGEAFGGTVTWDSATQTIQIYTTPEANRAMDKRLVDFSVSPSDLKCAEDQRPSQGYVRSGVKVKLSVKVTKADHDSEGGGKLVLTLFGVEIDRVPFFIDKGKDYIWFYKSYQMPLAFSTGGSSDPIFRAEVIPDAMTEDLYKVNNSAQITVEVQGGDGASVDTTSDSTINGIKVTSEFGEGLAKAGSYLTLKANVAGSGMDTIVDFYVNGDLVEERLVVPPKNGSPLALSQTVYVPYENTGLLNYSVKLDNGDSALLPVTVVPFEFQAIPGSITWNKKSDSKNFTPGETLFLKAKVMRLSTYSFTENYDALRAYFLVDGNLSPALEILPPSGSNPYVGEVTYSYKVPSNQMGPLKVKVFVDPGGLFSEPREEDNSDSAVIPMAIGGAKGNDVSVSNSSIRFAPSYGTPGDKVELITTVTNHSATYPEKGVSLIYKINGQPIESPEAVINRTYLSPGQSYTVHKLWTIPENMTSNMMFSVEIDPEKLLSGDDPNDNSATITIPMARSDLAIEGSSLKAQAVLVSGGESTLSARVYNSGPVAVENVAVAFLVDNLVVSRQMIDMTAFSTRNVTCRFVAPVFQVQGDEGPMIGTSGFKNSPQGSRQVAYTVKIDPDNEIAEASEGNNLEGPIQLLVLTPTSKGVVRGEVNDLETAPIKDALVRLVAGGNEATALSDDQGYVTFTNVPFGPYEMTATKTGYATGKSFEETLYSDNHEDFTTVYLDDRSIVAGVAMDAAGKPLTGVSVFIKGDDHKEKSDDTGHYAIKLPAGTYTLKYAMAGYRSKEEVVTLGPGVQIIRNINLETTDKGYLSGIVLNKDALAVSGNYISIYDVSGKTLATTVSGADGRYSLEIPLSAESMWIAVKGSHDGIDITQGIYMSRGLEETYDLYFLPNRSSQDYNVSKSGKGSPWVVCASMPGTFFNPDYKVDAIYGLFDIQVSAVVEEQVLTHVSVTTTPDFWLHSSVSSSWNPAELFAINKTIETYNTIAVLLPTSIPLAVTMHSLNKTLVRIKEVVIMSDGVEIDSVYSDVTGSYAYDPNKLINWDDCKIKFYLKVGPDNNITNPAAGYGKDRVLIIWNPKSNTFEKMGNYQVIGWSEHSNKEIYMDE